MIGYVLYGLFVILTGASIYGVLAVYYAFGLPAMYGVVFIIFVLAVRMERRRGCSGPWEAFGDSRPVLPPPGKNTLLPPVARQINQVQRRALPGPKK
jgi:hypothetical protein